MDDWMCGTTAPGQMRLITLNQFDPDQVVDLLVFQNHFEGVGGCAPHLIYEIGIKHSKDTIAVISLISFRQGHR